MKGGNESQLRQLSDSGDYVVPSSGQAQAEITPGTVRNRLALCLMLMAPLKT